MITCVTWLRGLSSASSQTIRIHEGRKIDTCNNSSGPNIDPYQYEFIQSAAWSIWVHRYVSSETLWNHCASCMILHEFCYSYETLATLCTSLWIMNSLWLAEFFHGNIGFHGNLSRNPLVSYRTLAFLSNSRSILQHRFQRRHHLSQWPAACLGKPADPMTRAHGGWMLSGMMDEIASQSAASCFWRQ